MRKKVNSEYYPAIPVIDKLDQTQSEKGAAMNAFEIVSFSTTIASLVLAIVAIVLSIVFYRMTSELSESTKEAAKGIEASVEKLEKLFDRLYNDTFSMMKDTVMDMRKHAWGEEVAEEPNVLAEVERKADLKIEALREKVEDQLTSILEGQQLTDGRVDSVTRELRDLVDQAINDSRSVEHQVREEAIRSNIISSIETITKEKGIATAKDLVNEMRGQYPMSDLVNEVKIMEREGIIKRSLDVWDPYTVLTLIQRHQ